MKVKRMVVGEMGTNCYLLEEEEAGLAAVIDPGDESERILQVLEEDGMQVEYILLTHGHFDHTNGVPALHRALPQAKVYIHRADADGAGGRLFPLSSQVEGLLNYEDGDALTLGELTIEVLHTPGHSPGSVCLKVGDVLLSGDTLFASSMGRTDLRGGSYMQIMASLKRLGRLEGNFQVCPGHDTTSTLDVERQRNPFLREAMAH